MLCSFLVWEVIVSDVWWFGNPRRKNTGVALLTGSEAREEVPPEVDEVLKVLLKGRVQLIV